MAVPGMINREMEYLVRATATSPICGWTGPARSQENEIGNIYFHER